jgi:hypothetical protein
MAVTVTVALDRATRVACLAMMSYAGKVSIVEEWFRTGDSFIPIIPHCFGFGLRSLVCRCGYTAHTLTHTHMHISMIYVYTRRGV